ncbi:MAG: DUF262 domain-containing protein [Rhodoferax sp.]|uniref:DUF262 domain-containing protein n=1 Tax=Rhodoferax sp. TaxID=50421 RepID=UPI0018339F9F|nr:DUF262 domain-containing protein [Rhodoferax sp.]NMM15477.1 DUF262 domain-containing protein [Rhodoferax sp.]
MVEETQLSEDDEAKFDELETLQNKIADQLSELSNSEILPVGYKSSGGSFEAAEVSFTSSSWLLRICQVQAWLRLNEDLESNLADSNPITLAENLFKELQPKEQAICVSSEDGNLRLTLTGAEILAEKFDVALRLQQEFIELCETLSKKNATELWIEAWEEEGEGDLDPSNSEQIIATSETWNISDFSYWAGKGNLNLNPSYQRGDVWPTSDAQKLIESVLRGIPLPSIILLNPEGDKKSKQYEVVDGKQRLTSLLRFIGQHPKALKTVKNESARFPDAGLEKLFRTDYRKFRKVWKRTVGSTLSDKLETELYFPFPLKSSSKALRGSLKGLAGKYYCEIIDVNIDVGKVEESVYEIFERKSQYKIPLIEYSEATPRQIQEVFHLYNKQGKHLNAEEIRNALFHDVELVKLLLVASGDNLNFKDLAPYFPSNEYKTLEEISACLDGYHFGKARYKRTKMLSWLTSLLFKPAESDGVLVIRSTAKQIDDLLGSIRDTPGHKLSKKSTLVEYAKDLEKCLTTHSSNDCWIAKFKDEDNGQRWQELQLVATLLAVFLHDVSGGNTDEFLSSRRKDILEFTKGHRRPENAQNKTQWGFIGEVALGMLELANVDQMMLESILLDRYGVSCLSTLRAARVHYRPRA